MTRLKTIASSLVLLAGAGLVAYPAFAAFCPTEGRNSAADGKKIAAQLDQNKTTLAKAIAAAEEHTKGRAISVISDVDDSGFVAVHVYCIAGDPNAPRILMAYFDHKTGKVKGAKPVEAFPITPHTPEAGHGEGRDHPEHGQRQHGDDHADQSKPHDTPSVKMIKNETLEAACGVCLYKMPGVKGCPLAVMIDGKPYLVEGAKWPNHDYCDRKCQAVVTGKLEGDKFIATSLEPKE